MNRLLYLWLIIPLALGLSHLLWGEQLSRDDQRQQLLQQAASAIDPSTQADLLANAAALTPSPDAALSVARAQAMAAAGNLADAIELLEAAVPQHQGAEQALIRHHLAEAHYHAAWLLRRDGASSEDWQAESEDARAHLRLLAEAGNDQAAKDLEMVIRFQRSDAAHLDPLALPKNCPDSCDNLQKRRREQRQSRRPQQSKNDDSADDDEQPDDAREELRQEAQEGAEQGAFDPKAGW